MRNKKIEIALNDKVCRTKSLMLEGKCQSVCKDNNTQRAEFFMGFDIR